MHPSQSPEENPSAELLEQLVGVLGGEIVNLAGTT